MPCAFLTRLLPGECSSPPCCFFITLRLALLRCGCGACAATAGIHGGRDCSLVRVDRTLLLIPKFNRGIAIWSSPVLLIQDPRLGLLLLHVRLLRRPLGEPPVSQSARTKKPCCHLHRGGSVAFHCSHRQAPMRMTMASCGSSVLVPCFFHVAQYVVSIFIIDIAVLWRTGVYCFPFTFMSL
uniref:Uncharacterized protein n=1 Tax=Arundo donax TaxID=35708 RepID=A0A0A9C5X8_ARUDO